MSFNIVGEKFGRLTVMATVSKEERIGGADARRRVQYHCVCDCGNKLIVTQANLMAGRVESCGCLRREALSEAATTHGLTKRKRGEDQPRLYHIWRGMKQRCYYDKHPGYEKYGGRGITVCDEWKNSFESFHKWAIANGYSDDLTIDRIDVDGNYEPDNCRWATRSEQQLNKQSHKFERERLERFLRRQEQKKRVY